jgi:hypothetical protein
MPGLLVGGPSEDFGEIVEEFRPRLQLRDKATGTGFEANTTHWSQMTQPQLSRKLDQAAADLALLKTNSDVQRIVWFGTEELPTTGLGGQLRLALEQCGIPYQVVNP